MEVTNFHCLLFCQIYCIGHTKIDQKSYFAIRTAEQASWLCNGRCYSCQKIRPAKYRRWGQVHPKIWLFCGLGPLTIMLRCDLFFCIPGPDDQNRWNRKNCPKFFHRVFLCSEFKSATQIYVNPIFFWITANIEKWSFFAYPDLMTKIDEIGKIARNSFIG